LGRHLKVSSLTREVNQGRPQGFNTGLRASHGATQGSIETLQSESFLLVFSYQAPAVAVTTGVVVLGRRGEEELNLKRANPIPLGILAFVGLTAVLICVGCGNDSTKPNVFDPPGNLEVINGDLSVALGWTASPEEGTTDFKQYDVYRGTTSLLSLSGSELANHKVGTVNAGIYTYTDHFATNGVRYFYHVRSEKTDGTISDASSELTGAGRNEGTGKVIEEFVSTADSGFDFSTGETVALSGSNPNRFDDTDIYLGTTADDDASGSPLALKSPELLVRLGNNEWISKDADLKLIGTDFDITTTETPGTGWANVQDVTEGDVYAIKTPSGNYAKIKVLDIEGLAGARKITFKYAYQPTAGLVLF
jgi:hypothetical protein